MEFRLGTRNIYELGQFIRERLLEDGVTMQSELTINVNKEQFKKIDEDLFYRNKKDDNEAFIPSEGEIIIDFDGIRIVIKEKE